MEGCNYVNKIELRCDHSDITLLSTLDCEYFSSNIFFHLKDFGDYQNYNGYIKISLHIQNEKRSSTEDPTFK